MAQCAGWQAYRIGALMQTNTELVRYDAMCRAIADAYEVDEVKEIRDKAVAMEAYFRQAKKSQVRVSASWIATEAMASIDPGHIAPDLIYLAANLHLRQIARSLFRSRFEDGAEFDAQHSLFPNLQTRYPAAHSADREPEYVLLESLDEADVIFNVERLRAEASAKMKHADALEAWWQSKPKAVA
jgi:hypothetical protein